MMWVLVLIHLGVWDTRVVEVGVFNTKKECFDEGKRIAKIGIGYTFSCTIKSKKEVK